MTSANLGKTLEYLKIQESLPSKNLTEYYLCNYFSTLKDIIQAQIGTNN